MKRIEKTHLSESVLKADVKTLQSNAEKTPNKIVSVRERTKLFESNNGIKCDNQNTLSTNMGLNNNEVTHNFEKSESELSNSSSKNELATPPMKPPRTFTSTEKSLLQNSRNGSFKNNELYEKNSALNNESNSRTKLNNECSDESKPRVTSSSFSLESSSVKGGNKSTRLLSAPEIHVRVGNGDLTPKASTPSNKACTIRSYFKNLSNTANNIREKVKQSKIFVDLTPTTVSPPKHYGTLKRSLSEEHIYAEPFSDIKNVKSPEKPKAKNEPLHYMCTPLIKPKVPEKKDDRSVFNRRSVRDVIYGSFAPLRTVSKDNQDSKAGDGAESDVSLKAIQARIIYVKSMRQVPEEYRFSLLPHICFPDAEYFKTVSTYQSETFHFTLFDKEEKMYGYCLRIMGWTKSNSGKHPLCVKLPVAICILSKFSAPSFYNKLLSEIEKHLALPREKCFKYIRAIQKFGVPNAGANVSIPDYSENSDEDRIIISRPLDFHSVGCELTRALQLLDVDILVKAVASLLLERKVLFFSSSPSNLYHCCKAISSLLYPFKWPHMFIPVLPSCLTVHCCSEFPFLLGLSTNNYNSVLELLAESELLIINIDKGAIVKSYNDEDTILPKKIQRAVITALNLAKNMTDPTEMLRDVMISEAFVHMFVEMVGHYENHFVVQNDKLVFQKEGFLKNAFFLQCPIFLQWFSETQIFDTFINESIWQADYRKIYQTNQRTFFEKRVDEYKWELSHDGESFSRRIEKTVRDFRERIIQKLKI